MRAKVKMTLTIPVVVEIHTEWDARARQSIIVGGAATGDIPITARFIYEHINKRCFHDLDTATHTDLDERFKELCRPYREKPEPELPEEEIRGVGSSPQHWAVTMKRMYGAYLKLPVPLVMECLKGLMAAVVLEPVLSRVPTVYIWNVNPAKDVLDQIAAYAESMRSPQAERLEEGCLRLRWTR